VPVVIVQRPAVLLRLLILVRLVMPVRPGLARKQLVPLAHIVQRPALAVLIAPVVLIRVLAASRLVLIARPEHIIQIPDHRGRTLVLIVRPGIIVTPVVVRQHKMNAV